jgi:hypothetical protein
MPIANFRSMGQAGVVSDIAPWDLPENAISDGRNFRVSAGKLQASGGSELASKLNDAGEELGHIDQILREGGDGEWVVCGERSIMSYYGNAFNSLYSGTDVQPIDWSTAKVGTAIFFNHPELHPKYWDITAEQTCKDLPWSPGQTWDDAGWQCGAIASHKNFLFGLGMVEDGPDGPVYYRDRVHWSHPVEPNGIPYTWEPANDADKSSLAGYVTLGRGGPIVGAESMRDSFVIYSEDAISILDYTGDALMWRRRTVSQNAGLIGRNALVEVRGQHFFMAFDDIMMFDGNTAVSLLHNRMRKKYASAIDTQNLKNAFAVHNKVFAELWFCFPEKGNEHANCAYVYNYRDNTWSIRDLSLEHRFRHGHFGRVIGNDAIWGDPGVEGSIETKWNEERSTWRLGAQQPFGGVMLGVSGPNVYNIDTPTPDEDVDTFIERTHMPIAGHDICTSATRIYPLLEGSSEVQVSLGSHQSAGDGVRWAQPAVFNPITDRKLDIRTTGELHAYRIDGKARGNWNVTGFDLEFAPAGKR